MDSADASSSARERAAARRAKILAKQKDRLSTITGVYKGPAEASDTGAPAQQAPAAPAAAQVISGVLQEEPQHTHHQQQQQQQQQQQHTREREAQAQAGQEQLQALMATLERQLQHAQAMATTAPQLSPQALELLQQQQGGNGPASWGSDAGPEHRSSSGGGGSSAAAPTAAAAAAPGPDLQSIMQHVPFLLQLGPALARSVKQTQLFRVLAAMLLAYAALTGWQLGLPPVALLVVMDLAVVLAGAMVLPAAKKPGDGGGGDGDGDGDGAAGDPKVPWRLRSLDLLSLVPGLRELLDSLAGYNAVATAVSQDFAAFVVVSGLLLSTNSVPAAVSWGLRF